LIKKNKNIVKNIIRESAGSLYYNLYKKFCKQIGNRTLIYHAFGSKLKHDSYGISINIKHFKEHMSFLKNNYPIIDCFSSLNMSSPLNSISITIDDGYKDTINAVDILNNYKMPFTLFISTGFIGIDGYLTENDVFEISKLESASIGSHGVTHKKLSFCSDNNQFNELQESKKTLERITNKNIDSLSFPHGSFNNFTIDCLRKLDYKWAASSLKGINNNNTDHYKIFRSEIISSDKIKNLQKKINGFYDFY